MLSTLVPVWCLACIVCAACFSQSSAGGSPGAAFDAAMGDEFGLPDGTAPGDGTTPEASSVAPEAGPETSSLVDAVADVVESGTPVTVIDGAGYEAGVQVIFEDASGSVLGAPTTGTNGAASLVVPAGSLVTVVMGTAASPVLYTVLGVQPGQQVPVQDWGGGFTAPTVDVTALPSSPGLVGVTQYVWDLGGARLFSDPGPSPSQPWSISLGLGGYNVGAFGTTVGAVTSSFVQAEDALGNILGFARAKVVPSASPDGGPIDLSFGSTWSTTTTTQTVGADVPDAGTFTMENGAYLSEVDDGVLLPLILTSQPTTHVGFADFTQAEVEFNNQNWGVVVSMTLPPTSSGAIYLDASGLATAPAFTNAGVSMSGTQPTLSWTLSQGSLAGITGLVAITPFTLVASDGGQVSGTWTLVSPGTAQTSIAVPALPPLASMAGGFGTPTIYAVTGQTAVTQYGDLLKVGTSFWPRSGCVNGPFIPALPSVGTALVSIYSSGQGC